MSDIKTPKVFISYSWKSDDYRHYVVDLASALRSKGVDTVLDTWDLVPGQDRFKYMERMINDPTIDKVLVLCDKSYMDKANDRKGGVGSETKIITPEIYENSDQNKFIPVVMEKDDEGNAYIPTYLKSSLYVDYTKITGTTDLLRAIYEIPKYEKPSIGSAPAFARNKNNPKVYRCAVCGDNIIADGLLVKLQKPYGKVLHVVPVHKGECDERLEAFGEREGINTDLCLELSFFDTDEDREAYINNDFSMSDSEFFTRYYNADGTLKKE